MGRKRKDVSLAAPLAARKRRRPEQASGGWASLATDMVGLVTNRLLDSDVADYIALRAVCSAWRACTPTPRELDPALRDARLRPRGWVALCGGDAVRPDDAREVDLFHTRTARRLRVRLPKLRGYRIVTFSDGLLVLLRKSSGEVRVLHPFTHVAVDFPSFVPVFQSHARRISSYGSMKAAVCTSTSASIAVVVWFKSIPYLVAAEAGSDWEMIHQHIYVDNTLVFQGRLYGTTACGIEILQLYPLIPGLHRLVLPTVSHVTDISDHRKRYHIFLAESVVSDDGQMLLVVQHHDGRRANLLATDGWEWERVTFVLYRMYLNIRNNDHNKNAKLVPVSCLHDRSLFLGNNGCLSISALDLPSLAPNSIYFSMPSHPALLHSLATGLSEELGAQCQIHDRKERIRPSVRPFTIADHLLTFCNPHEWVNGLMFHEYHIIPISFKELWNKIKAKERQLIAQLKKIQS